MKEITKFNFDEIINNIEAVKDIYIIFLFSFFAREKIIFFKKTIYSFDVADWKKDRIWEALNGDISIEDFYEIAKHMK